MVQLPTRRTATVCVLAAAVVVTATTAPATAATRKPTATRTRCAPGSYPIVQAAGRKLKPKRDKRGRLRCRSATTKRRPAAPATSATRQLGLVADTLQTAGDLVPGARRAIDRRLGRKRASALLSLALNAWRKPAGVARAHAHASGTTTTSFGSEADGTAGKVSYGAEELSGDKLGFKAQGDAEVTVSPDGLKKLAGDKVPPDVKSAGAKVSVSFEDAPQACPSAAGVVPGRLHGKASLTITITSKSGAKTEYRLSADANMTYRVKVGEDGKWTTVDDVDMQTEFQGGGTGQATQTYRGHRLGSGFGRDSILGSSSFSDAITRDAGHMSSDAGGVFGPKGGWNWKRGVTLNDLRSIDNVKAMVATSIATDVLMLGGLEYLRGVALKRGEKHWYDDEQCMTLDGTAVPASLRPKGVATVTASKAKAKDGGAVPAKLTATGAASIDPGAADLPLGGTKDFKLTAPATKGAATWTVIGVSRGGKKTVSGSIPVADDLPAAFSGTVTSTFTAPGIDQSWTGTLRYDLTSRQDNPDGSVSGLYALTTASITITDDNPTAPCGTYRFSGSGGVIDAGELELQIAAAGSRTYGFQADVRFANATHLPLSSPLPMGCPGSFTGGLVKAFLNARTAANGLRDVAADGHLEQSTTSELPGNVPGVAETAASWDLAPS